MCFQSYTVRSKTIDSGVCLFRYQIIHYIRIRVLKEYGELRVKEDEMNFNFELNRLHINAYNVILNANFVLHSLFWKRFLLSIPAVVYATICSNN